VANSAALLLKSLGPSLSLISICLNHISKSLALSKDINSAETQFHLFSDLSLELRWKIWRHALPRERIITVQVYARYYPSEHLLGRSEGIESAEGSKQGGLQGDYDLIVEGNQVLNKFLRITQESRRVALKFYRVHLP
jgi:hypothetical protein